MSQAPAATVAETAETPTGDPTPPDAEPFDALAQCLREGGPGAMLDALARRLDGSGDYRGLLDARLLQARHDLGLTAASPTNLADVPEATRLAYEAKYVEAIREVGGKLLAAGDVAAAWPYFRAIGEPEPVALAVENYRPAEDDERLHGVVEVAFNQGANPRAGYALILRHYGTCSAVTAFEHLPRDEAVRSACADLLVRQLHDQLVASLRAEIAQRGQPLPAVGGSIPELIAGRDWVFADEAYHVDVSHLAAAVRAAPLLTDPATLALAVELTDYGRRLSPRYVDGGEPPFDHLHADHAHYLRALLGIDADAAVAHFRSKLEPAETGGPDDPPAGDTLPAQVLVNLLARLSRFDEAVEISAAHLAGIPDTALGCPGLAELCRRANRPDRLAAVAREGGDLVRYASALLQARQHGRPAGPG